MPAYNPVEALLRGLQVLEAVNRLGPARIPDLQADTGINRATLVRMLETLVFAGYVQRRSDNALYQVTSRSRKLSSGLRLPAEIAERATPILARLQERSGWPCDLAVCDGVDMVTVANSPAEGRFMFNRPVGWTAPVLASSLGLAYVAFCSDDEQSTILAKVRDQPGAWNEAARDPSLAAAKFAEIRARGYATIDPRWAEASAQPNLRTIGVPVIVQNRPVAAMNFIFINQAIEFDVALGILLPPLKEAADALAIDLAELYEPGRELHPDGRGRTP